MSLHLSLQEKLQQAMLREKELQHRFEELNDFIENASFPLQAVNGSGIVIWANQAYLDMLGYTKAEYINTHVSGYYAEAETTEIIMRRLLAKEVLKNFFVRMKHKSGAIKHMLINTSAYWKNGEIDHTRCFVCEVTDIKEECDRKDTRIAELEREIKALKEQSGNNGGAQAAV
jgi:two-component system, OmpR family, sensor histidine kinase VicK